MKIIKLIALAAFAVVAAGSDAATTRTTFRDSMGRKTGSVEDNGKGKIHEKKIKEEKAAAPNCSPTKICSSTHTLITVAIISGIT